MSKFGDDDRRGRGPGKPYDKPYRGSGGGDRPYRSRDAEGDSKPPRGPKVERFGRDENRAGAPYGQRSERGPRPEGERRPFRRDDERPARFERDGNRGEGGGFSGERRPPRRFESEGGDRPPRRFQRDGDDRPPRRSDSEPRIPRPFEGEHPAGRRFDGDSRPPRRFDGDSRPPRRFDGDSRPPRRSDGDSRPPRRFDGEGRPPRRFDDDSRPARRFDSGDRPRRSQGERGEGFRKSGPRPQTEGTGQGHDELRQYGWNACLATYRLRPEAVRKVYLHSSRIDAMRETLQELAERQIGYRIVENEDLEKLTQTQHHEGICFDVVPPAMLSLDQVLGQAENKPNAWLVWLDGVGNPHNLGAILRSAAHFGCAGVVVHRDANLKLSGAAARVAEGGAECVPLVRIGDSRGAVEKLRNAGFRLLATSVREGDNLFKATLPSKLVWLMGAEGEGVSATLQELADSVQRIPGTGAIESLNVSAAFAVFAAETHRAQS
ncbi:TrmH family RNA methyltransferase [Ahniella affigens]|uniref:TrmH family RNA methyltransferase n=1 Tax=Ahniella affigens TaxID=2021234 RepID=UPI0014732964|nr:TrmH family RNA methyltransferase [Ahniella affigens]